MIEHYFKDPKFSENWFDYQDVYRRIVDVVPDGGKIIEIGAWKGASTSYLAVEAQHKKLRIDVIDTWVGSDEHKEMSEVKDNLLFGAFVDNLRPVINYINPIRIDSLTASKMYEDESVDAIFIDADHKYESVKADILSWLPKIKKAGILAGHDYAWTHSGVIQAVDELIPKFEVMGQCWYFVK
jgi:predicted O-methyltransferase YrrM